MKMKNKDRIDVVLIGNPNTGKTSLLNALTGMSLHVGNWPGKTVEKKEGRIFFAGREINLIDLPGSYSIAPYSEEEKVSHEYLMTQNPDVIIQTVDVNALERNLLMTMELLALGKKIVLAFNFNREAKRRGITVETQKISEALQLPIVEIEAHKGENKETLLREVLRVAAEPVKIPDYLDELVKKNREIHHDEAIALLRRKIAAYYKAEKTTEKTESIDSFLLNKYWAFPVFLAVIFLIFKATFTISTPLVNMIDNFFGWIANLVTLLKLPEFLRSFFIEGVIGGLGSVLSFAPLIFILFFLIAILEDSGYLGRTVIIVDRLFHKFGISGRAFIPMILGFGCNVPAVMATRTIKDRRERLITIFINSFMSCGARLPVYLLFTGIFFPKNSGNVVMVLYLTGVLIAFLASFVLSKILKNQEEHALIIELPPYRMPTLANTVRHAWFHTREFIRKAGTIIFGSVLVIWTLASLPWGVTYGSEASLLGMIGKTIAPIFGPLGFAHWPFAIALISGVVAKEVIIGTLGTLFGAETLAAILPKYLTPLEAMSFLFFVLLYIPCLATIAVIKKESNSIKFTILQIAAGFSMAWLVSFLVYNIGSRLGF